MQSQRSSGADSVTCTIEATQAGDDRWAAAPPVRQSFLYKKAAMKLTATGPSKIVGTAVASVMVSTLFVETARNSGLSSLGHVLSVVNATPDVCQIRTHGTVDLSGGIWNRTTLMGLKNGTCTLNYSFAGTADRAPATTSWSATISGLK